MMRRSLLLIVLAMLAPSWAWAVDLTATRAFTLSEASPLFRSATVSLDALTASMTLSLQRPTTAAPLNWDEKSTVRVSLVYVVDGVEYRCTGQASGGIRTRKDGVEASIYTLSYKPPVLLDAKAREYLKTAAKDGQGFYNNVPLTRLGELGATVQGYVELELLTGTVETAITLATTTEEPAPTIRTKNSVAFNAATDGKEENGDGVLSVSHTASGSDRAAFAGVGGSSQATAVTSITYAGSGMTQLWDFRDSGPSLVNGGFILAGVGTGAQTVTSTLDAAASDHALGVISFTGVDQTTPTGNTQTATNTGTSATVTVTGVAADDMVVDNIYTTYGGGGSPAVGANQTERYAELPFWIGSHLAGSTQAGADGGVMSWTFDSRPYTLGAVRLIAAAGGGGGSTTRNLMLMGVGQ
jgi:hypothetical protein